MAKFTTFIAILLLSITGVFADGNEANLEEFISKYKIKVEKANSRDWLTYAECANALVSKRIASSEVLEWVNKSIEIKETSFNRVVLGDYLVLTGKIKEAQAEYIRAINIARENGNSDLIPSIQWKVLVSMGIENYNNFQANN